MKPAAAARGNTLRIREERIDVDVVKKAKLRSRGWTVGSAVDLLDLSPEEALYIEFKLVLSTSLRAERQKRGLTQVDLAGLIGSSQSRVAKMEAGDPTVTIDLLFKALLALGVTRKQLARYIA